MRSDGQLREASSVLVTVLVLEGLAALIVTLLNLVTSRELGQDFLPWESYLVPGIFGALCLVAAFGVMRSKAWAKALAAIVQLLVLALGVAGLVSSGHPVLWVAVGLGVLGLLLLNRTTRTA
jgi:hypothetical protein